MLRACTRPRWRSPPRSRPGTRRARTPARRRRAAPRGSAPGARPVSAVGPFLPYTVVYLNTMPYVNATEEPKPPTGLRVRIERIALVCAMSLTTINIWTGGPLFALWVGSRVQSSGPPSMAAAGGVAVVVRAGSLGVVGVLAAFDSGPDPLTGPRPAV